MHMIEFNHVSYNFGSYWALKDVSFKLDKGDYLFLTGPSGAGKTTLLRLLYGALKLTRGAGSIAGFNLKTLPRRNLAHLRRQVGFVFQDFKILPHRSVFDNVAIALEVRNMSSKHISRRVNAVLRSLKIENKAPYPCGDLSGGEQQRVAIARAIVVNPKVILADEPSGNLDPDLSMRLMHVFDQFHTFGATVVLATHNRDLLQSQPAAKILKIRDGQIVEANWPGGRQLQNLV